MTAPTITVTRPVTSAPRAVTSAPRAVTSPPRAVTSGRRRPGDRRRLCRSRARGRGSAVTCNPQVPNRGTPTPAKASEGLSPSLFTRANRIKR